MLSTQSLFEPGILLTRRGSRSASSACFPLATLRGSSTPRPRASGRLCGWSRYACPVQWFALKCRLSGFSPVHLTWTRSAENCTYCCTSAPASLKRPHGIGIATSGTWQAVWLEPVHMPCMPLSVSAGSGPFSDSTCLQVRCKHSDLTLRLLLDLSAHNSILSLHVSYPTADCRCQKLTSPRSYPGLTCKLGRSPCMCTVARQLQLEMSWLWFPLLVSHPSLCKRGICLTPQAHGQSHAPTLNVCWLPNAACSGGAPVHVAGLEQLLPCTYPSKMELSSSSSCK